MEVILTSVFSVTSVKSSCESDFAEQTSLHAQHSTGAGGPAKPAALFDGSASS